MTEQIVRKDWLHDSDKLLKIAAGALVIVGIISACLFYMLLIALSSLPVSQQQIQLSIYYVALILWPLLIAIVCLIVVAIGVFFRVVKSGAEAKALATGGYIELSKTSKVLLIIFLIFVVLLPIWILIRYLI